MKKITTSLLYYSNQFVEQQLESASEMYLLEGNATRCKQRESILLRSKYMRKRLLLTVLIALFGSYGFTQVSYQWSGGMGSTSNDNCLAIEIDDVGNLYYTGEFYNTIDLDPGLGVFNVTSSGGRDVYIVKLDPSGNFLWGKSFGGGGNDRGIGIAIDGLGNVYTTGYFSATADLDPGVGISNFTSVEAQDIFVQKLDSNGDLVWVKTIGCLGYAGGQYIAFDPSGFVYITGGFESEADFDPGAGVSNMNVGITYNLTSFILKLDVNGNYVWSKANNFVGSGQSESNGICINQTGDVYTTGIYSGTVDFDPGLGSFISTSNGGVDAYIQKLDSDGNFLWVRNFGGTGHDRGRKIVTDSAGDVYSIGEFQNTVDFDPGTGITNITASITNSRYIQKLTQSGDYAWVYEFNAIYNLTSDDYGSIYTTGAFSGTVDFDFGVGTSTLTSSNVDMFVQRIDASGDLISVISSEASVSGIAGGYGISVNTFGEIAVGGTYQNAVDFDPTAVVDQPNYIGANDVFVVKYSQCFPTTITPDVATLSNLTGECSVAAPTAPTASNCSGTFNGTPNVTFPITTQGTTVVTWTYDDGNGNTSTQTQNVVIDDVTDPVADVTTLSNITSECEITSLTAPTATDNCVGSITGTHNVTLPITASGTTTITWTYDDGNGNTSTQTQNVIITPIDNGVTQVDAVTLSADATGYNYQWIDCNNGNQAINGATSQTYVASSNGSYAVEIDNGTCMITSNCMVIDQVGISEIGNTELVEVYPNPTTGTIYISSSVPFNKVELMNALGQKIETNNISETSKYLLILPEQNGVYFVKVHFKESTIIKRIIKE